MVKEILPSFIEVSSTLLKDVEMAAGQMVNAMWKKKFQSSEWWLTRESLPSAVLQLSISGSAKKFKDLG